MNPLLLDLLVIAIVALFAFFGWKKGLILTLCGLLAIFVAFFAAAFVSKNLSAPVAAVFQPAVEDMIEQGIQNGIDQVLDKAVTDLPQLPEGLKDSVAAQIPSAAQITISQLAELLEQLGLQDLLAQIDLGAFSPLAEGALQDLLQAVRDKTLNAAASAPAAIAGFLCQNLARLVLFYFTFVVVLILWKIFSHALDLACRLPVLHTFNEAGGLLIGLVKGLLIALAAAWLLTSMGIASPEQAEQTYLFHLFLNFQLL